MPTILNLASIVAAPKSTDAGYLESIQVK